LQGDPGAEPLGGFAYDRNVERFVVALGVLAACGYPRPPDVGDDVADPIVGFEFSSSGADEMSGTIQIPVVLSAPSDVPVTVSVAVIAGGTATPDADFDPPKASVEFAPNTTRAAIDLTIVSDTDESEASETVDLALSAPEGATLDASRSIHEVRIADHILPRASFSTATSSTTEDTPTELVVNLTAPSEGESTVVIGWTGTASVNDLSLVDGTVVTIPASATSIVIPVGEIDDAFDEDDETADFELKGASQNLVIGTISMLDHTIVDNDPPPTMSFTTASSMVNENVGTTTVTVALSTASGRNVTAGYAITGGTASLNTDLTVGGNGTLVFSPGQTTKTITLTIVNDNLKEGNETAILSLSNATNATLANPVAHTLTIIDDD